MNRFEVDCAIFSSIDSVPVWHDCLQVRAENQNGAISMAMQVMENMEHFDERIDPYRVIYGVELVSEDLEDAKPA